MQSTLDRISSWMTRQSWYSPADDGAPRLRELAEVFLPSPDPLSRVRVLLVRDEAPAVPVVYQLPLVERDVIPDPTAPGLIGRGYGGASVFDGVGDAAFGAALLAGMHEAGTLRDEADDRFVVGTEVLEGDDAVARIRIQPFGRPALTVRLFRRVVLGPHPHAVAATALAEAGSAALPRLAGVLTVRWLDAGVEQSADLAVAEESVDGAVDAWTLAAEAAASGRSFAADAFRIGETVGAAHSALARIGTRAVTPDERATTVETWRARIVAAAADVPALATIQNALLAVVAAADELPAWPSLQQVHGALELGLLQRRPEGGWMLDAIGGREPSAVDDRADLELRDVAGLLRSLHYVAAFTGADPVWESEARTALLQGATAHGAALPAALLDAVEADFAVIDAVWEARTRPEHVSIPLGALARICSDATARDGELSAA